MVVLEAHHSSLAATAIQLDLAEMKGEVIAEVKEEAEDEEETEETEVVTEIEIGITSHVIATEGVTAEVLLAMKVLSTPLRSYFH